ncbi:hypothetical protein GCM10010377_68070 [Streptomyces viridiviolaceus]|nr:hypothetical protein GCM10010377_68070 [Streptomyces viridiviolaceus]
MLAHQLLDALAIDEQTALTEFDCDPLGPVRLPGRGMDRAYSPGEGRVGGLLCGLAGAVFNQR